MSPTAGPPISPVTPAFRQGEPITLRNQYWPANVRPLGTEEAGDVALGLSDVLASCSWCRIPRGPADGTPYLIAAGFRWLGGVWCDLDDEVGVESGGDPLEQGDGRDDAARFQAGEGWLGHAGAGGELDLGESEGQAPLADGLADQVGPLRLGIAFSVVRAVAPRAGQLLIGAVIGGHVRSPSLRSTPIACAWGRWRSSSRTSLM